MSEQEHNAARERWSEVEALLSRVLDLEPQQRSAYLDQVDPDQEIRREVESLAAAEANAPPFLESNAVGLVAEVLGQGEISPGDLIGAYRVVREIGAGGMGRVYLAERADDFQQRVAIKTLYAPSAAPAELIQRFLTERQILATLEHPNIARIFDGGSTRSGVPYLVMEHVEGQPITQFAQEHDLDLRQRLELFDQVSSAVDYAHRRLIVHRDLKPSNILVSGEADPQVKLVDFGIAKIVAGDSADPAAASQMVELLQSAPETRFGAAIMTPEYAAPEQIRGEPISTGSDVYSLGVVLFELLTGARPYDLEGRTPSEVERLICDTPAPRLSAAGQQRTLEDQRPAVRRKNRRELSGDLETIVGKCLAKEASERYHSTAELAADLRRYRQGRPIHARPAAVGYRLRKFVARHKVGVAAAAVAIAALVLGAIGVVWQASVASREAQRAEIVGNFLVGLFEAADPETEGGRMSAVELLDQGAERLESLEAEPAVQVDIERLLGTLYSKLGEAAKAESFLRRAVARAQRRLDARSELTLRAQADLGTHLALFGDPLEARDLLQRVTELATPALASAAHESLGVALMKRGRYQQAEDELRRAIELAPERGRLGFVSARMELGNLLIHQERWIEAEELLRQMLATAEAALGAGDGRVSQIRWNLAELMLKTARFDEAEAEHLLILEARRALYPDGHPDIARSYGQLGAAVQRQGRLDEARDYYQQAVNAWQDRFGEANPALGEILTNLAALRYREGDLEAAAATQRRALEIWRAIWGDQDDNLVAAGINNLGVMERELGDLDKSERRFEEAIAMRRRLHGDRHATVGMSLANLAKVQLLQDRFQEAEENASEALAICGEQLPPDHIAVLSSRLVLGGALVERARPAQALPHLEEVEIAFARLLPADDARVGELRLWLGIVHARLGEKATAATDLEESLRILEQALGPDAALSRRAKSELVNLGS